MGILTLSSRNFRDSKEQKTSTAGAVTRLAGLFDFMRVSSLIKRVEDNVLGRLLIMFPGAYADHVYRFMAAREGVNYMAVPITSTASFIDP